MSGRIEADNYPTPDALALAICKSLRSRIGGDLVRFVEPSAGGGPFVRAAIPCWPDAAILAVDIRDDCRAPCEAAGARFELGDWLSVSKTYSLATLIIGNPPYSAAEKHVHASIAALAPGGYLAFLLRLSFLGSQGRAERLWSKPGLRYLQPIAERPSFINGASDNSEYALFVWQRGYDGNAELLPPLFWRVAAAPSISLPGKQPAIPLPTSGTPRGQT